MLRRRPFRQCIILPFIHELDAGMGRLHERRRRYAHTAPNPYMAGGGPYWCGFIITGFVGYLCKIYGDSRLIERYYPYMQKWLEYVDEYTVDGL